MDIYNIEFDIFTGTFFLTYGVTVAYFFVLMLYNKKQYGRFFKYRNFAHNIIGLQLFNISAYTLNRTLPVFHESVDWLVCFLIISNVALVYQAIRKDYAPSKLSYFIALISTLAFC